MLRKAKRIIVLSGRDKKIINRYYGIPPDKIENIGPALMPELHAFQKEMFSPPRKVAFLGSMKRLENRDGLQWFVKYILPECPKLEITIIGETTPESVIEHSQLKYLGYIDDIEAIILEQDLMIAPLFSQAGIKIKVIESLLLKVPVLGSINAYSGLPRPKGKWCSNNPEDWIEILNGEDNFWFDGI
ncbi:glycosyltransferase [Geothrix fermentans]|uniref:glycosyltransferase n=1 Tax=Geothrix fermentans TaxID=44676 RepID=UPI00146FBF73|nr:glycosyltransferase [Geothrix fermentans]